MTYCTFGFDRRSGRRSPPLHWIGNFFSSFFLIFPTLLPPVWPPCPLESKVIQIQSDHPRAFSPPVLRWLKRFWSFFSPPSLFFRRASGLLFEGTTLSSSPSFFPPFSHVPLGRILHALGMTFAMLGTDCVSGFPPFEHLSTVVWLGLATCWRRTSERNLSVGSLQCPRPLFHAVSPSPGLNRHALDLTVSLDDQGQ